MQRIQSFRPALALVAIAAAFATNAQAGTVAAWNFDTAWAAGTTDTSGYGGGWVSRAGAGWNAMTMDYASGAAYGRSGGVAVITNTGNDLSSGANAAGFAGVRLLLVDGPGTPNADGYAFREAFESSMNKAYNPFVQVDFWDDGSNLSAGLFAYSIRPTDAPFNAGSYNRVATSTADAGNIRAFENDGNSVRGTSARVAQTWRTLRMELETDGDVDYFIDGVLVGTSAVKYDTLTSAYNSAFSMLVGTQGGVAGAQAQAVFDNFQFGNNVGNVPEPGSLALAGLALFGLAAARRRSV